MTAVFCWWSDLSLAELTYGDRLTGVYFYCFGRIQSIERRPIRASVFQDRSQRNSAAVVTAIGYAISEEHKMCLPQVVLRFLWRYWFQNPNFWDTVWEISFRLSALTITNGCVWLFCAAATVPNLPNIQGTIREHSVNTTHVQGTFRAPRRVDNCGLQHSNSTRRQPGEMRGVHR
jgi:hypothetical protein